MQETARFCAACRDDWVSRRPTIIDEAICQALKLSQADTLQRHVLEARLLSQQTPLEISTRCAFPLLMVTAYSQLIFDVRSVAQKGIWLLRSRCARKTLSKTGWFLALTLKQLGCFDGRDALEQHLDVLCRLNGPTMADGLPDRSSPRFPMEFQLRQALADPLLPRSQPVADLMHQFEQAAARDVQAGQTSEKSVDLGIEILRKAKIPAALRKEIARLRENCTPRQEPSTRG